MNIQTALSVLRELQRTVMPYQAFSREQQIALETVLNWSNAQISQMSAHEPDTFWCIIRRPRSIMAVDPSWRWVDEHSGLTFTRARETALRLNGTQDGEWEYKAVTHKRAQELIADS